MPFKPKSYTDEYEKLPVKYQKIVRWFDIAILGILVITFFYPYYMK
jgi:hypothetical protein